MKETIGLMLRQLYLYRRSSLEIKQGTTSRLPQSDALNVIVCAALNNGLLIHTYSALFDNLPQPQ